MASSETFVQYVIDQIKMQGDITYKKMFGEYLVYANGKPAVLVCDNTDFVNMLDCVRPLLENAERGCPYEGAKEHYIVDVDNSDLLTKVVTILEANVPLPKPKKKSMNVTV
jgi:TfoX/Sxy family transcriptional regulator of competence genes